MLLSQAFDKEWMTRPKSVAQMMQQNALGLHLIRSRMGGWDGGRLVGQRKSGVIRFSFLRSVVSIKNLG
jgi:hypothetical protein